MTLKYFDFSNLSHTARGKRHGEAMRSEVRANIDVFATYFEARGASHEALKEEAVQWLNYIQAHAPDYADEMNGIADGAGVPIDKISMLNVRHEIGFRLLARQAKKLSHLITAGCTSVGLLPSATAKDGTLLAQTLDGLAAVRGTLFVARSGLESGPMSLAVFEAGCAGPSAGLNDAGLGFVYNSLLTASDGTGPLVPPFKVRTKAILASSTFDGAIRAVVNKDRSSSINYLIGHKDSEMINIEAAPAAKYCSYPRNGMITHANHFEPESHILSEWERFLPDTLFRSERLSRHLTPVLGRITIDHIISGLTDHFSHPSSICLHPDSGGPSGRQASTLSAIVLDLKNNRLLATDGPPCEAPVQEFQL